MTCASCIDHNHLKCTGGECECFLRHKPDPGSPDHVEGYLEVGCNDVGEVILNLDHERNGIGHLVFSPAQARAIGSSFIDKAKEGDEIRRRLGL